MRKLSSFIFTTLNGYIEGPEKGDISWHRHGQEESDYAAEGAGSGSVLLFGRVTYNMMAGYWPTPMATESSPAVAEGMNRSKKIVFSRTLKKASWQNTEVLQGDLVEEVKKLKQADGPELTILGSGSVVSQLSAARLIDEYQVMVDPVLIGNGTPLCLGLPGQLDLRLLTCKAMRSGVVLLTYAPAKN